MTAYIVVTSVDSGYDDNKHSCLYPPIIGPFLSDEAASDFIDLTGLGRECEDVGGYSEAHIVSDSTADDPLGHLMEYFYRWEDTEPDARPDFIEKCRSVLGDEAAEQVAASFVEVAAAEAERAAAEAAHAVILEGHIAAGTAVHSTCECQCGWGIQFHADLRPPDPEERLASAVAKMRRRQGRYSWVAERALRNPSNRGPKVPEYAGGCSVSGCEKFVGVWQVPEQKLEQAQ